MNNGSEGDRLDRIEAMLQTSAERARAAEERFDAADRRIQEKHEALAQTVEILVAMHRDNESFQRRTEERFQQVTRNFEIVLDSIKRLENIALSHEQRLDDLEGQ